MPHPARLTLIAVAWLLCVLVICAEKHPFTAVPPSYQNPVPATKVNATRDSPFYKEEFINYAQHIQMAHVASLAELPDGSLAAVWYGGSYEYWPDVNIYFASQTNGVWSVEHSIMTVERAEHDLGRPVKCPGNAILLANPDGTLRLLFITIAMGKWSGSELNTCLSHDGGLSWSPVSRLTLSPLFNFSELVRNRPILLATPQPGADPFWCVPIYQELIGKFPELLWLTVNHGEVIAQKSRIAGGCSTLQPSLVPLDSRRAVVLLRDYTADKKIFIARTPDAGLTWSKPVPTNLPNPDSGVSGLRLSDGRLLVAFNNSTLGREKLSLALSRDEGKSWKVIVKLDNDPDSYSSYPFLLRTSDGMIHVAYTYTSNAIKMVTFNEAWITDQEAKSQNP
jgi:predicted neuraminidase